MPRASQTYLAQLAQNKLLTLIFIYCIVRELITRHLFEHSDKMNRLRNNLVENIFSTQGKNAKRKKQTFRQQPILRCR